MTASQSNSKNKRWSFHHFLGQIERGGPNKLFPKGILFFIDDFDFKQNEHIETIFLIRFDKLCL